MQKIRVLRWGRASALVLVIQALLSQVSMAALISQEFEHSLYGARPRQLEVGRSMTGLRTDLAQTSRRLNSKGQPEKLGGAFVTKVATPQGNFTKSFQVDATYVQLTPYWAYGLSETLSIYASLPIYQIESDAREVMVPTSEAFVQKKKTNIQTRSLVKTPNGKSNETVIGQATLAAQYLIRAKGNFQWALTPKVRIPTGARNDLAYFTQGVPEAQGFGAGIGVTTSTWLGAGFELLAAVEGTYNFNDEIYVRAIQSDEILKASRDPGETGLATATLDKVIFEDSHIQFGYSFEQKWADELPKESVADGAGISKGQRVHVAYAYSPPHFLTSERLASRMAARISYSHLVDGENILDADTAAVELTISY